MSKKLGDSVHDFFDDLSQRRNAHRGFTLDEKNAETKSEIEILHEPEICTPSNDELIEGYVVIEMLDTGLNKPVKAVEGRDMEPGNERSEYEGNHSLIENETKSSISVCSEIDNTKDNCHVNVQNSNTRLRLSVHLFEDNYVDNSGSPDIDESTCSADNIDESTHQAGIDSDRDTTTEDHQSDVDDNGESDSGDGEDRERYLSGRAEDAKHEEAKVDLIEKDDEERRITIIQKQIMHSISINNRTRALKNNLAKGSLGLFLPDRVTESLNIRSSDGILRGKSSEHCKPDTPYPPLYEAHNVPSGVLGDGFKPTRTADEVDTPVTDGTMSQFNRYSTELDTLQTCQGKVSETPRFSSVIRELEMRPTSGTTTNTSDSSGRKNPQAKVDSEIRNMDRANDMAQYPGLLNCARNPLPPIHSDKQLNNGERRNTRGAPGLRKDLNKPTTNTTKVNESRDRRKPSVPRLLRSSVCYHDGKVDVSIFNDKVLMENQSNPVLLNINFVQQPTDPVNKPGSTRLKNYDSNNTTGSARFISDGHQKQETVTRTAFSGVTRDAKQTSRPGILTGRLNTHRYKPLPPIQHPQKLHKSKPKGIQNKPKQRPSICQKKKPRIKTKGSNKNVWCRDPDPIDWNIVDRRAQKPPFNTHVDIDASYRHKQFFMDY